MTNYNKEHHLASIQQRAIEELEKNISIANALAYAAKHDGKDRSKKERDFLISHFLEIMEEVDLAKSTNPSYSPHGSDSLAGVA